MKLSVLKAYEIHESIASFLGAGKSIKGKVGLALAYNFRLIHDAMGEFITKRNEIISKYADPIDDDTKAKLEAEGKTVSPTITNKDMIAKAESEILEYGSLYIDIPIMEISQDDIMNTSDIDSESAAIVIWMCKEYNEASEAVKSETKKVLDSKE